MPKLPVILAIVACIYFVKAKEIPETSSAAPEGLSSEAIPTSGDISSVPSEALDSSSDSSSTASAATEASPSGDASSAPSLATESASITPLSPIDDIKNLKPADENTVVQGFAHSESSSMKVVDGVVVEDKKNEQTVTNDNGKVEEVSSSKE